MLNETSSTTINRRLRPHQPPPTSQEGTLWHELSANTSSPRPRAAPQGDRCSNDLIVCLADIDPVQQPEAQVAVAKHYFDNGCTDTARQIALRLSAPGTLISAQNLAYYLIDSGNTEIPLQMVQAMLSYNQGYDTPVDFGYAENIGTHLAIRKKYAEAEIVSKHMIYFGKYFRAKNIVNSLISTSEVEAYDIAENISNKLITKRAYDDAYLIGCRLIGGYLYERGAAIGIALARSAQRAPFLAKKIAIRLINSGGYPFAFQVGQELKNGGHTHFVDNIIAALRNVQQHNLADALSP